MSDGNKNVVLIMGAPNTGKTTCLRHLVQDKLVYLNTDLKEISFDHKFMATVDVGIATDILGYMDEIESKEGVDGVVLDTLTFAMSMYERQFVAPHAGTKKGQAAWGHYANFYGNLMHKVKAGSKDYFILAHDKCEYNAETLETESKVPIKGAVGRQGVEADFTVIVSSLKMPVKKLKEEKFQNPMLIITEEEEDDGVKYVFQTRPYKGTGNTCRGKWGMWERNYLYIDADANALMNHVKAYNRK